MDKGCLPKLKRPPPQCQLLHFSCLYFLDRILHLLTTTDGQTLALCAAPTDVVLPSILDASELEAQQQWLAGEIELWLNDEWTKLDVHRALGEATAQAYGKTRLQGSDEIGEVLLNISSELLTFDFKETFVNAFDVANKAAELLMKGMGREVCCG
ncbi:hypothetical protein WJX82_006517 [Trebouxia sp. C0006]